MLTHDNICSNVRACVDTLRVSEDDTCLALLPLSHILERMVEYYFLHVGVTIVTPSRSTRSHRNLQEVRPTIVAAVPRVYERSTPACSRTRIRRRGERGIFSVGEARGGTVGGAPPRRHRGGLSA